MPCWEWLRRRNQRQSALHRRAWKLLPCGLHQHARVTMSDWLVLHWGDSAPGALRSRSRSVLSSLDSVAIRESLPNRTLLSGRHGRQGPLHRFPWLLLSDCIARGPGYHVLNWVVVCWRLCSLHGMRGPTGQLLPRRLFRRCRKPLPGRFFLCRGHRRQGCVHDPGGHVLSCTSALPQRHDLPDGAFLFWWVGK